MWYVSTTYTVCSSTRCMQVPEAYDHSLEHCCWWPWPFFWPLTHFGHMPYVGAGHARARTLAILVSIAVKLIVRSIVRMPYA